MHAELPLHFGIGRGEGGGGGGEGGGGGRGGRVARDEERKMVDLRSSLLGSRLACSGNPDTNPNGDTVDTGLSIETWIPVETCPTLGVGKGQPPISWVSMSYRGETWWTELH